MRRIRPQRSLLTIVAAAAAAALLVAPGILPVHAQSANAPVEITFWSWVPKLQPAIDQFNQTHPGIHVKLTDNESPATIYTKYTTVLQAKSGAPDVAQIEYDLLPTYEYQANAPLVDMGKYGANSVKGQFPAGVWSQVSAGSSVYGIPQDTGPMGMYYRKDLFAKYKIPVPTTWADYAKAAATLHKADPNLYITNFSSSGGDYAQWAAYMWQAGGNWASSADGSTWNVSVNSLANKKAMNYWGNLANQGLLKADGNFTPAQYKDWQQGHLATWICAVWGANTILSNAANTSGKWAIANLPQWTAGQFETSAWGGSTNVVFSQTKHPQEATTFAVWLNTDQHSINALINGAQIYPASTPGLKNPALAAPYSFYGGQSLAGGFTKAAGALKPGFSWGPAVLAVRDTFNTALTNAYTSKSNWGAVLDKTQQAMVTYMKSNGFTVK